MKILFFSIFRQTPHWETELELMKKHLESGDEIYIINCKGELSTCFGNPDHKDFICTLCKSKFRNGLSSLKEYSNIKLIDIPFQQKKYEEIPNVFQSIDELKGFKVGNATIGLGATSSLISRMNREHKLDTVRYKEKVFNEVNNAYYVYQVARDVLKDLKPEVVYIFNGRFSTFWAAITACEEQKITYYTHERAGKLNKYWIIKDTLPHDTENVKQESQQLWESSDQAERERIGEKFFIDRRKRVESSWYSYTKRQKPHSLPSGFDKTIRNIGIYNTTIEEYVAIRGWENPIDIYNDEITAFRQIFSSLENEKNLHIYLRVHPNLRGFENTQMRDIKSLEGVFRNVTIIYPESKIDSYALMDNCDIILTFGSTMGIEACYWNKPSILIGKSYYRDFDCCYIPKSHQELIDMIRQELTPKSKTGALKYGHWELSRGVKYEYFNQTGLFAGKFLGRKIRSFPSGIIMALIQFLINPVNWLYIPVILKFVWRDISRRL